MEFLQQSTTIVNDLIRIDEEVIEAYSAMLKQEREKDIKSICERIIQECSECEKELALFFPRNEDETKTGKHYLEWKGVKITHATKKSILVVCANDVLAVMNACFSALTSSEIDSQLRDLLAKQQARLSKLYFYIEQFHDRQ